MAEFDLHRARGDIADALSAGGWPGHVGVPGSHTLPAAIVRSPTEILYDRTYGPNGMRIELVVELRVSRARELVAQRRLDAAVVAVPRIIKTIASDQWRSIVVERAGPYHSVDVDKATAFAVDLTVVIIT